MNRILGIPLKIAVDNSVYIPRSFLLYYGIPVNGPVIREELPEKLLFCAARVSELQPSEKLLRVYQGHVHIRPAWMSAHQLSAGDRVWLIGTEEGLVLYPHSVNALLEDDVSAPYNLSLCDPDDTD